MKDSLELLDQALDLGRRELGLLGGGDADEAALLAENRGRLTAKAWEMREGADIEDLREKLVQLRSLQGRLTGEARRLHESIKGELARTRQEGERLAGYGKAVRKGVAVSRFVSKKS